MEKRCSKCKEVKSADKFYADKRVPSGLDSSCKMCREKYKDKIRKELLEYQRRYRRTKNGKEAMRRWSRKAAIEDKEKMVARSMVNNRVVSGTLQRKPCEVCGTTKHVHGHHKDYSRPLDVTWLCRTHHVEEHKRIRIGKN